MRKNQETVLAVKSAVLTRDILECCTLDQQVINLLKLLNFFSCFPSIHLSSKNYSLG
jgi:hypothetical protein